MSNFNKIPWWVSDFNIKVEQIESNFNKIPWWVSNHKTGLYQWKYSLCFFPLSQYILRSASTYRALYNRKIKADFLHIYIYCSFRVKLGKANMNLTLKVCVKFWWPYNSFHAAQLVNQICRVVNIIWYRPYMVQMSLKFVPSGVNK